MVKFMKINTARDCFISTNLRYLITPYVSSLEEDFRPIVRYAIVDCLNGFVYKSGFTDSNDAKQEVEDIYNDA